MAAEQRGIRWRLGVAPPGLEFLRLGAEDAPPLVYFPGLIDASFSPKEILRRRLRLFGEWTHGRAVYVISRRRPLPPGWTIAQMAGDYAEAIHWVLGDEGRREPDGNARIDVAGASFGGCVAMQYALDHGGRLRRLVLQQVAARGDPHRQREAREWITHLEAGKYLPFARAVLHQSYPRRPRWLNDFTALASYPLMLRGDFRRRCADLAGSLRALDGYDVMDRLGEIPVPTLVVGGARDEMVPAPLVHQTAAALPAGQLHLFPEGSHSVQVEYTRAYARCLREFLDAEDPAALAG